MTYPPQPGQPDYGQQPGSFGQQPGGFGQQPGGYPASGGYPQPGGFPQSGGFPQPGQPPYGQPYPGYDPSGGGGGFPPPGQFGGYGTPPPGGGGKKGLWIGLSVGLVVILAALGITGFWKPGFFLSGSSSTTNAASGPQNIAQQVVDGINQHDKAKLSALKCQDSGSEVQTIIDNVTQLSNAKLSGVQSGGTTASATVTVMNTNLHQNVTGYLKLADETGKWCWQGTTDSPGGSSGSSSAPSSSAQPGAGSGGSGSDADYRSVVQNFLDKINGGDASGAMTLVCPSSVSDVQSDVTQAAGPGTNLTIKSLSGASGISLGSLSGTVGGEPITVGTIGTDKSDSGSLCIDLFSVF
jgi:hypothetical protein